MKNRKLSNREELKALREGVDELPGNGGNAYSSSKMLFSSIKVTKDDPKVIASSNDEIKEDIQFEPSNTKIGGVIVFSEEENDVNLSPNELVNWFKKDFTTFLHSIENIDNIDKITKENNLISWTIGRFLKGTYTAENGKLYGENSLSIEIVGISTNKLIKIAKELCALFVQESVVIKDYSSQKILFVRSK